MINEETAGEMGVSLAMKPFVMNKIAKTIRRILDENDMGQHDSIYYLYYRHATHQTLSNTI